jgi:hypothetical protein
VLAARACVPGHIGGTLRAVMATGLTVLVALLTLTIAAARPIAPVPTAPLGAWLEAHELTYGLAGYWNSSVITLHSFNGIQVRAVAMHGRRVILYDWETNTSWFDPSRHDATFVIIDLHGSGLSPSAERYFGKPVKIGHVAHWAILIYPKNLLERVAMAGTGHARPRRHSCCRAASDPRSLALPAVRVGLPSDSSRHPPSSASRYHVSTRIGQRDGRGADESLILRRP